MNVVGGVNVPEEPPEFLLTLWASESHLIGGFNWFVHDNANWVHWPGMTSACLRSALTFGVFESAKNGPRGGWRHRVVSKEKWAAWRAVYCDRAAKLRESEARKRLGGAT